KAFAPAAFAHAEKLRAEARDAFDHGDPSGAQILAEHALAAYAHAQALARIARAERGAVDSDAKLKRAEGELGGLEAEQAHAAADADALELQIRVTRDAQAVVPSGKVDPERERARLAAARSLALQARLLCAAARLLTTTPGGEASAARAAADPKIAAQLADATSAVDKLDDKLKPSATLAPIDEATRARAGCLAALTLVRRAATPVSRAPGVGDALLAELAAGALAPSRDDRGVVVTLRDAFHGESLTPDAEKKLKDLARVAAAHPAFPVEVVVHGGTPKGDEARAAAVAKALSAAAPGGKLRIEPVAAASASPVVDPAGPSRARNARVEIVFVTPETF
ncbi:MAG TPA: hypothetical protein VHB21_21320, partial [Minicystis sp.]|nr:hypothetical protein [Minicystis sp.]